MTLKLRGFIQHSNKVCDRFRKCTPDKLGTFQYQIIKLDLINRDHKKCRKRLIKRKIRNIHLTKTENIFSYDFKFQRKT